MSYSDFDKAVDTKSLLQSKGYFIRLTEWTDGFQAGAVLRTDTRVAFFSPWFKTEQASWDWVLEQVLAKQNLSGLVGGQ